MPVAEIQVTGQRPRSSGSLPQRGSPDGHQVVMDGHARYQQAVADGNVYIGGNPLGTPVTSQAGLSATTPVLTLYNPPNSGKAGVLWGCTIGVNAAPAAATIVSLYACTVATQAIPSAVTAAKVTNAIVGGGNQPVLQCARIATLPAAPDTPLAYLCEIDAASSVIFGNGQFWLDGAIIIGPAMIVAFQATTAVSLLTTITWEEINA
jgi:hypothetical protein